MTGSPTGPALTYSIYDLLHFGRPFLDLLEAALLARQVRTGARCTTANRRYDHKRVHAELYTYEFFESDSQISWPCML